MPVVGGDVKRCPAIVAPSQVDLRAALKQLLDHAGVPILSRSEERCHPKFDKSTVVDVIRQVDLRPAPEQLPDDLAVPRSRREEEGCGAVLPRLVQPDAADRDELGHHRAAPVHDRDQERGDAVGIRQVEGARVEHETPRPGPSRLCELPHHRRPPAIGRNPQRGAVQNDGKAALPLLFILLVGRASPLPPDGGPRIERGSRIKQLRHRAAVAVTSRNVQRCPAVAVGCV